MRGFSENFRLKPVFEHAAGGGIVLVTVFAGPIFRCWTVLAVLTIFPFDCKRVTWGISLKNAQTHFFFLSLSYACVTTS